MATQLKSRPLAPFLFQKRIPLYLKALKFLILSFIGGFPSAAGAQTSSQQYVYGSQPNSPTSVVSGFTKAAQTGGLNPITGFPIPERFEGGLMAIDGQGKFLFILNAKSNNISMFQIDQASGALSEVPASPFQVPPTINPNLAPSQPISIAAEKSGKFLFVGYFLGDIPGLSAVVSLAIDTSGLSPVLVTQHSIQTNTGGAPAQLLTDPKGLHLYVGLSQGQNKLQIGGAEVYSIDPASGTLGYLGLADSPPADEGRQESLDVRSRSSREALGVLQCLRRNSLVFSVLCSGLWQCKLDGYAISLPAAIRRHAVGNFDDHAYDIGDVFVRDAAPAPACSTDADSEVVSPVVISRRTRDKSPPLHHPTPAGTRPAQPPRLLAVPAHLVRRDREPAPSETAPDQRKVCHL